VWYLLKAPRYAIHAVNVSSWSIRRILFAVCGGNVKEGRRYNPIPRLPTWQCSACLKAQRAGSDATRRMLKNACLSSVATSLSKRRGSSMALVCAKRRAYMGIISLYRGIVFFAHKAHRAIDRKARHARSICSTRISYINRRAHNISCAARCSARIALRAPLWRNAYGKHWHIAGSKLLPLTARAFSACKGLGHHSLRWQRGTHASCARNCLELTRSFVCNHHMKSL